MAECCVKISLKINFHSNPLAPPKIILDYKDVERCKMKVSKYNKKIVNYLILASSLFGSSASIITTAQATQRTSTPKQEALRRQLNTRAILKTVLSSPTGVSLDECIRLVRECEDATIQVGRLTLLEEAILSQSLEAVNVFIKYGANIHKAGSAVEEAYRTEFTLLHFALLSPQEMKEFCKYKNIGRGRSAFLNPYVSKEIVEALLNSLKQDPRRLKQYVNKPYTRTDEQGKTETIKPLDLAIESRDKRSGSHPELRKKIWDEYTDIIKLLLEHEAECNEKYRARLTRGIMLEKI
jgi:hypothetical protein